MNGRPAQGLLLCGGLLLGLTLLGLHAQAQNAPGRFAVVVAAQSAVYFVAVRLAWDGVSGRAMAMVLGVALLARLPVVAAPPYLSSDVYRYVWDGRVAAAGINPYRYIPADPHLAVLRDREIFPHINRSGYAPTIYPPVAQGIFLAVTRFGERPVVIKTAMVGFEALTVALLLGLLSSARLPTGRILVYAWHPLPLWEFAGSGHIDAALVALVVLALWARRQKRRWLAGVALAAAALVKLYPAVLLPAAGRRDWRPAAGFATAVAVGYLPFIGVGWKVLGFLPDYAVEQGFTRAGSGFYLLNLIRVLPGCAGVPAGAYIAGAGMVLALLAARVFLVGDDDRFSAAATLAIAFTVLVSPHYPWYFAWLVVFACFAPRLSLLWLTVASFLLYLVPPDPQLLRSDHRLLVESMAYGPFAGLAVLDLFRRATRRR